MSGSRPRDPADLRSHIAKRGPADQWLEIFMTHEDGQEHINIVHMYGDESLSFVDRDEAASLEGLLSTVTWAIAAHQRKQRNPASADSAAS